MPWQTQVIFYSYIHSFNIQFFPLFFAQGHKKKLICQKQEENEERGKKKVFLYWVSDHQIVFPFHVSILMYILPSVMFVSIIFIILNLEYKCCFFFLVKMKIFLIAWCDKKNEQGKLKAFRASYFQVYTWLRLCIIIFGIPTSLSEFIC